MNNDYLVLDNFGGLAPNQIAVAASFNVIGENAPDTFTYDGKEYQRGMTASIPMEIAQDVCSVRIYECGFVKPQTDGIVIFNEYPYKYIIE